MKKYTTILFFYCISQIGSFCQQTVSDYMLGSAKLILGQYDSAIYYLTSAIKTEPSNINYYLKRGESLLKSKNFDKSVDDFAKANTINPGIADLWLAKAYALLNDENKAIIFLEKHLKSDFREPESAIRSDVAFDNLQYKDSWYLLWQNDWYNPEEKLKDDIDYLVKKEKFTDAVQLIDDSIRTSDNKMNLYRYRAQIFDKQGNYNAASMDWTQAISLNKGNNVLYRQRGNSNLHAGKYREAVEDFSKVLRNDPAEFDLYLKRAEAYGKSKDYNPAVKDMEIFLKCFPDDQNANFLCSQYYFENKNYASALKYINKNLARDSLNYTYLKARGKAYFETRIYKLAFEDLSMSLDLNPHDGETYYYMGMVKFSFGNLSTACSDWKKAVELGENRAVTMIIDHCK